MLSADSALIEPFLFTPKTRVCLRRYAAATTTKNNKSRYPQCPRLWNFGNIISNFQRFLLCAYCLGNGGARRPERPLVSIGWIRCSENLRKKCKLKSNAKHGSRGDLVRELHGGFLAQPREASSWKRSVLVLHSPRSRRNQTNDAVTLKDGALNQQRSLETSVHAPPTRKAKDVRSPEPVYDITNVVSS